MNPVDSFMFYQPLVHDPAQLELEIFQNAAWGQVLIKHFRIDKIIKWQDIVFLEEVTFL